MRVESGKNIKKSKELKPCGFVGHASANHLVLPPVFVEDSCCSLLERCLNLLTCPEDFLFHTSRCLAAPGAFLCCLFGHVSAVQMNDRAASIHEKI